MFGFANYIIGQPLTIDPWVKKVYLAEDDSFYTSVWYSMKKYFTWSPLRQTSNIPIKINYDYNNDGKLDIGYINSAWGDDCGLYDSVNNRGNILPYKTVFINENNNDYRSTYAHRRPLVHIKGNNQPNQKGF